MTEAMEMKGIDDLLAIFRSPNQRNDSPRLEPGDVEVITTESDSGDDFKAPSLYSPGESLLSPLPFMPHCTCS
jgi:hypothetical protein